MKDQSNAPGAEYEERLKRQSLLFAALTSLDERSFSLERLITQAVNIISPGWISSKPVSVRAELNSQLFTSADYKETVRYITSGAKVRGGDNLSLTIFGSEEYTFTEADQQLADVIANTLSAKIDRLLSNRDMQKQLELGKAYELARIGTWEYDMLREKLYWSGVTKKVHGFDEDYEPDIESTINLFKEGYDRKIFAKAVIDAIENNEPFDTELKMISGKGDERWIRAIGVPEYKEGVCTRFYGISQNVTDRREAEEEVELNNRRFKALVQHGMDMIAILDEDANYLFASPTSLHVLGLPSDYFFGKNAMDFIHEDDKERIYRQFSTLSPKETAHFKPFRFLNSEGSWRWLEATVTNLIDDPAVHGYVSNSRDVTERQLHQEQIAESLKEKETLLAEIHHRIKNNLSVLTGILQLQAANENNEEVLERLFDSVARIHTMAGIHEQLYQSNNFSSIKFADRLQLLALNIRETFQSRTEVELNFQCEEIELPVDKALPGSLIANEVLTNIFKHAFTGRDRGRITIELKMTEDDDRTKLTIADNGNGLPDDFTPQTTSSLGLSLIHMLAEQLPGEYSFTSGKKGTEFTLLFDVG